jgi:lipopolysaccharide transport system ATP-binding protein
MSDVAQEGRTVLFVSHNMSAILRLTQETILLDKGNMILRAPTPEAVDYYMASGYSQSGERQWDVEDIPPESTPFRPLAIRVLDIHGRVIDTVRSTEPVKIEIEYVLDAPIKGLRVGIYLLTMRGEFVFTSFDTDTPQHYEQFPVRPEGHYVSQCEIPANFFNEGRYVIGMNASSFRVKSYFHDEHALAFSVDGAGAPGTHWSEARLGPVRPRLDWEIESR